MADTPLAPPITFAGSKTITGFDYLFAQEQVKQEITDRFDAMGLQMVPLIGDLAGMGTDTLRNVRVDGVGFATTFTAMDSENSQPTPVGFSLGYDEFVVGMYDFAMEETWKQQVLGRAGAGLSLDDLIALVPQTWAATFRSLWTATGATIADTIGSSAAYNDVDDLLELVAYMEERLGAAGTPLLGLKPAQMTKLKAAFRAEPAFASFATDFSAVQRFDGGQRYANFAGLNLDVVLTDDILNSGGAYQGFAARPGAMGWVRASPANIRTESSRRILLPEFGLIIVGIGEDESKTDAFQAVTFLGMGLADPSLAPQVRFLGKST